MSSCARNGKVEPAASSPEKQPTAAEREILFRENGRLKDGFYGYTPLILASLKGDTAGAKAALATGADVNWKMEGGYTALMLAADQGHTEIVRILLAHGADPNLRNDNNLSALDLANREGRTEVVRLLRRP